MKFRIWNTVIENWENPYYLAIRADFKENQLLKSDGLTHPFRNFYYNCVIQQFTGMLDKNGKDIYVGDLIKIDNTICSYEYLLDQNNEVVFDYFAFGLKTKDKVGNRQFSHLGSFEPENLEVVGNIFENPELISKP